MVIYICNRNGVCLTQAASHLPEGNWLLSDELTDDVTSGIKTYSCILAANEAVREAADVGNYLLVENSLFTIVTRTFSVLDQTVTLYCEDAGLDLLNKVCPQVARCSKTLSAWITNTLGSGSGWSISYSGIKSSGTMTLEYTSEQSATARLLDILDNYGAEMSFSYTIDGLKTVKRTILIQKKRSSKTFDVFKGREVKDVSESKSLEDFATVLVCYGKNAKALSSLEDYSLYSNTTYKPADKDVFNFDRTYTYYVTGNEVRCTTQMSRWKSTLDTDGAIKQVFSYENASAKTVITAAMKKLEKIANAVTTYEVDFAYLPQEVMCGDYLRVLDSHDGIMMQARIQELKWSPVSGEAQATLSDFKTLESSKAKTTAPDIYTLGLSSSEGVVSTGSFSTTLSAMVYRNGTRVTLSELTALGLFIKWYKGESHIDTGESCEVTDLSESAVFLCRLESADTVYARDEITLSVIEDINEFAVRAGSGYEKITMTLEDNSFNIIFSNLMDKYGFSVLAEPVTPAYLGEGYRISKDAGSSVLQVFDVYYSELVDKDTWAHRMYEEGGVIFSMLSDWLLPMFSYEGWSASGTTYQVDGEAASGSASLEITSSQMAAKATTVIEASCPSAIGSEKVLGVDTQGNVHLTGEIYVDGSDAQKTSGGTSLVKSTNTITQQQIIDL